MIPSAITARTPASNRVHYSSVVGVSNACDQIGIRDRWRDEPHPPAGSLIPGVVHSAAMSERTLPVSGRRSAEATAPGRVAEVAGPLEGAR
jgi:hypothetical protein